MPSTPQIGSQPADMWQLRRDLAVENESASLFLSPSFIETVKWGKCSFSSDEE